MDIKSCKFCRKTFMGFGAICPTCAEQLDAKYMIIRNYLDKNSTANISCVADETGVDDKSLLFLIREGRIALKGVSSAIKCLKCGAAIFSGKYCDKCKGGLVRDLETTRSAMENSLKPVEPKIEQPLKNKSKIHILKEQ